MLLIGVSTVSLSLAGDARRVECYAVRIRGVNENVLRSSHNISYALASISTASILGEMHVP
jgi:hypothetical protein